MPETADETFSPVPPTLVVSKPLGEDAPRRHKNPHHTRRSRRRTSGLYPASKELGPSDWTDIDESPTRRKRSNKRSEQSRKKSSSFFDSGRGGRDHREDESGRFFPRLSRILEKDESTTNQREAVRDAHPRERRERSPARRSQRKDDRINDHRRPLKHRTGGVQRRTDSVLKVNPSLLSVLSGLTGTSDRSSGSGSTITQESYDQGRHHSRPSRSPPRRPRRKEEETVSQRSRPKTPNVFDYMEAPSTVDDHDGRSVVSSPSSSSHYEPSDAGSSEMPDTPSSRSTFPSPTTTRRQSVAELRRKYDPHFNELTGSHSPASSERSLQKQPFVDDVVEEEGEGPTVPKELADTRPEQRSRRRSSSRSSSGRESDRVQIQEEAMRQHMTYGLPGQPIEYNYAHQRSQFGSSFQPHSSPYAERMQLQQYQWPPQQRSMPSPPQPPPPPVTTPPQPLHRHPYTTTPCDRPTAPDPPDLSRSTLTGYELLALELASLSSIRPLYRKFTYLNHRLLLHLQDELSELEQQLRTFDEVIAQLTPAPPSGRPPPAFRRAEAYSGSDIHARRTHLLGRVFLKTEQYNRAMASFAAMEKEGTKAEADDVQAYQAWLRERAPVHEVETRFLQHAGDLIEPGRTRSRIAGAQSVSEPQAHGTEQVRASALIHLPVALMLPVLLFSLVPTLAGRLAVAVLIAAGGFVVVIATRVGGCLSVGEWVVVAGVYGVVLGGVAGCIPLRG